MPRDSVIPSEGFEEILAWLDTDRDVAAKIYLQLWEDLKNILRWKGCNDPEGLTDEVFDRVAIKVNDVRPTYRGDPRLYFRAVANNVFREYLKQIKMRVSLDHVDLQQANASDGFVDEREDLEECLQLCLQKLSVENRELILGYYAKEKQAKIDHRSAMARQLGTSVQTLRVRVFRIRATLEECIQRCLNRRGK